MNDTTTEPRAWVGCLSCYNGGRLTGAWLTGEQCSEELKDSAPQLAGEGRYPSGAFFDQCRVCGGDEWWVMDHEGIGAYQVEMSPEEFGRIAAVFTELDADGYDVDAFRAFLDYQGSPAGEVDEIAEQFREAYNGCHDSGADFAEELAEDTGSVPEARWPFGCIDWERAWRELEIGGDYFSTPAPGGGVYVFRGDV